jgi:Holliday junction resolvasome RuvABC endonuclease subunit
MARLRFDVRVERNLVPRISSDLRSTVRSSVRKIAQDLARTASESAPHLTGDLEDSYAIEYQFSNDKLTATVEFAVFKGGFNYAIAMHEWTYNLGAGSQAKAGGTGMSGTSYAVGRKFLTRVLEGESEAYTEYIAEQIRSVLGV